MAERSMKILWMVLLIVAAYQDFRERQVSVMWMVCGAAAGMIGCYLMAGERYQGMLETGIDAEREPADEYCEDPDSENRKSSRNRNCAADPCKID